MATDFKQYNYPNAVYCGESFAATGCGPTSCADLLSQINKNINPVICGQWLSSHGYAAYKQGTIWGGISACLSAYGGGGNMLATDMDGRTSAPAFTEWQNTIQSGFEGVLLMHDCDGKGTWTRGGHYIAIVSYDAATNRFLVYDPASTARTGWHHWGDFVGNISALYTSTIKWGQSIPTYTLKTSQIAYGSQGALVLLAQEILASRGYYSRKSGFDGSFGDATRDAVIKYQKACKLSQTGVIDNLMWQHMLGMPGTNSHVLNEIKFGDTGVEVLLLQEIASAYWYYNGALDKSFGPGTFEAVKLLQRRFGLVQDGICGAKTWKAILTQVTI